jgi:hypothetical protein
VRAEGVALIPSCASATPAGCRLDENRWQAYLTDDEPPEFVVYCRDCAEREFGDD